MQTRRALLGALMAVSAAQAAINVYEREALPGPAPGTCQVITEGNSQITLCLKETKAAGDDTQLVEGFLYNSGKTNLCGVKLEGRGAGDIKNMWPDWATTPSEKDADMILTVDQQANVGMLVSVGGAAPATPANKQAAVDATAADATAAAPAPKTTLKKKKAAAVAADADATTAATPAVAATPKVVKAAPKVIPKNPLYATGPATIGVAAFKACDGTDELNEKTSRVKTIKIADAKAPAPAQDNGDNAAPAQEKKPAEDKKPEEAAQPQQQGNKLIEIVEDPIAEGPAAESCQYYKEGAAEFLMCVRAVTQAGDDVKLVDGFFYNNGTVPICNILLEPSAKGGVVGNIWPDWATGKGKEELIFQPGQVSDAGMTVNGNAANPSILVGGFKACDGTAALKKDSVAITVPLAQVKVPEKVADAAPVAPKKTKKTKAATATATADATADATAATADATVAAPATATATVEVPATDAPKKAATKKAAAPKVATPQKLRN